MIACWGKGSLLLGLSLVSDLCTVCHGLFAVPLGVSRRLYSVIVACPGKRSIQLSELSPLKV